MGKTSSRVKDRYNAKSYDRIELRIPKGQKAAIQAHAQSKGESINGMVNRAILADMGLKEWPAASEDAPEEP
jgi:predicted HicB family RNase H-like nuclease